jgi:hypothetical protein
LKRREMNMSGKDTDELCRHQILRQGCAACRWPAILDERQAGAAGRRQFAGEREMIKLISGLLQLAALAVFLIVFGPLALGILAILSR